MHRLRRLHDSQYIMKNPFTNENSNLSNIFHNNIHRKKVESLKVRSTEEFLCQFAWLPCRFFRGRRQGRQPLNNYIYIEQLYIGKTGTLGSLKFLGAVSPYPHMLQTQPHVSFGARWWTNTEILERTEHPTNSCNMLQISAYVKKKNCS